MSDNDVLVDLLDRAENETIRKPENIGIGANGDSDHSGGYDLINPNLHHGVDDVYRPVPSSERLRSSPSIDARESAETITETFQPQTHANGPTATTIINQSAYEDPTFSPEVSGHFLAPPASEALTLSGSLPAGLSTDAHAVVISGAPAHGNLGSHPVAVMTADVPGIAIDKTFVPEVGDSGPIATAIANQGGYEGQRFSLDVSSHFAASPAGDALTYSASLPAGLSIDAHTGIISGVPTDGDFGSNPITVMATDAHGMAISESFVLEVGDSGPTATAIANQNAYKGQGFSLDASSHFMAPAVGNTLTFSGSLPNGLHIDAHTGIISGVPTDGDFGSNPITVTATDAHGMAISESFVLQVGDSGPTATAIANQSAYEGQSFSLDVSNHFTAPAAGDTLTFSGSLPTGLHIDAHTGIISGVPTDGDFGSNPITVTATDAHGMAISESFVLQVGDSGPTATVIANQSAYEGQSFSLDVSSRFTAPAADNALIYSASLPAGLSIDAHTGVISGVPTDGDYTSSAHEYNFNFTSFDGRFTVTGQFITSQSLDAAGGYDVTAITGSVIGPNGSIITGLIDNPTHSVGSISPDGVWIYDNVLYANSSTLVDYGGVLFTSNNYEYNIFYDAGHYLLETLNPQGILNPGEVGSFTITAVPADHPITVTATDTHGMAVSETFHLQVGDSGPTATAIANQSTYVGQSFLLDVSSHFVVPAAGDALTFSGSMPGGLSIDAHTGIISGVPTQGDFGDNPIKVTAIDAHGMTISESFNLQVNDHAPVITSNGAGTTVSVNVVENATAVTTVTATDADAGSALTYSIAGGVDAARFTVNASTGALSFVSAPDYEHPADAGGNNVYDVVVQVSDGSMADTQAVAVSVTNVNDNAPVITSNGAGAAASVNVAENATVVTTVTAADADAGSTLTYSIAGGADASHFTINASTGALSLASAPDYENPTDAGDNNDYDVTVKVSDGTLTDTQAIAVTVADVAEHIQLGNGGVTFIDTGMTELSITGGAGNDTITGMAGVDHLYGGAGNDTIVGGGGADILDGGTGTDTVDYSASSAGVTVNLATTGAQSGGDAAGDVLSNFENVTGSAFNDSLIGDAGANMLTGGAGDDVLIGGGTGNMLVNGSFEADHIAAGSWAPSATLTGWTAASGDFETWNHLTVGGHAYTASDGVQSIELDSGMGLDSFYQDVQTVSGAQYTLSLDAAMRADAASSSGTIQVYWNGSLIDSFDPTSTSWSTHGYTVTGDGGSDRLMFSEVAADNDSLGGLIDNVRLVGNDILDGGTGNDTLIGGQGNDTLIGGSGTDTADYSTATAAVTVNLSMTGGQNTVGAGTDTLSGIENLTGSNYNDTLTGDANDNTLTGGAGNNTLVGGAGNDTLIGGAGNDTLAGGTGTDTADYSSATGGVTANLNISAAQDTVHAGTDTLSGIENLTGSRYNDTLTGDGNDNLITGGLGNDTLAGGNGSDTFIYHVGDGNDTVAGGAGASWTDAINLHDGTSALGTYGVDWTLSITSGSIISTDTAHHIITLSQDTAGQIELHNGATINFTEIERVTW
jgi:Ca2+-binding RTX toxin-like protein